jgi:hypothetical protein
VLRLNAPSGAGLAAAERRLRDPLLLGAGPIAFAVMSYVSYRWAVDEIGFDFIGTIWEPARALLGGREIFPAPTREEVEIGNPAVYPPFVVLVASPLALMPPGVAAWVWLAGLACSVFAALWLMGVRDWRCLVLAVTSPVVLQGLLWGNLTVLLLLPLAVAWRKRNRSIVAGLAVGLAVAAKLFVWPLIVWLLITGRLRAASVAFASAALLLVAAWAVIGFDGLREYPALLRAVQDVYATRSVSLATVVAGFGGSGSLALAACAMAGVGLLCVAWLLVGRPDGDRRSFTVAVAASVVASPIMWPNYAALLFVPIAARWPRLSAAWFFGYAIWFAGLLPKPYLDGPEPCCRPEGLSPMVWALSHATPAPGHAIGTVLVVLGVTVWLAWPQSAGAAEAPVPGALHPVGERR